VIRTSKKSTHYTKRQAAVLQKAKKSALKRYVQQAKPSQARAAPAYVN